MNARAAEDGVVRRDCLIFGFEARETSIERRPVYKGFGDWKRHTLWEPEGLFSRWRSDYRRGRGGAKRGLRSC